MTDFAIDDSDLFILTVLQACLRHPSLPTREQLGNRWLRVDVQTQSATETTRTVRVALRLAAVFEDVQVDCIIEKQDGIWQSAACQISFALQPQRQWRFVCDMLGNRPVAHPRY
ncbi:hypothetical protein JNJ66_07545 [Candidatus Saccharibacteria bacterium]|nr:hypothetical protein [Candidatus Saccharibacteria bacterium]